MKRWVFVLLVPLAASAGIIASVCAKTESTVLSMFAGQPAAVAAMASSASKPAVPVYEKLRDSQSPMLIALEIDGGYTLAFEPELRRYQVLIPAGHPRVPKVTAQATDGAEVVIDQAVIPDSRLYGTAYVVVKAADGSTGNYEITFVKDPVQGFQLQYQDRWTFVPNYALAEGESFVFTSSDSAKLPVSSDGVLTVAALSAAPITVTASVNGVLVDSLTVDALVKAPLNIFFITGQSNASGTYDIPGNKTEAAFTAAQLEDVLLPQPGTVFCTDVNPLGRIENLFYDLSKGRIGFSPALGKTWYDLTGEKSIMLQTAVGGSPIEAWLKPTATERYTYLDARGNFYETTFAAYEHCLGLLTREDSGYELNRRYAYWLQGETGINNSYDPNLRGAGIGDWIFGSPLNLLNAQEYYDLFMRVNQAFREDMGVSFTGILLVRATESACSAESVAKQLLTDLVPPRVAQYALNSNGSADIGIVSRVCDLARKETSTDRSSEGWGYMGCYNLHYNQSGHNANGVAAAENSYLRFYDRDGRAATALELIHENGRDRFADGELLSLRAGSSYQTAAAVLPLYSGTRRVECTVADGSVCEVDTFGRITAKADAAGCASDVTFFVPGTALSKTIRVSVSGS